MNPRARGAARAALRRPRLPPPAAPRHVASRSACSRALRHTRRHPCGPPFAGWLPGAHRCASRGQAAAQQPVRSPRRVASCAPRRHGASSCAAPRVQRRRSAARRLPCVARWRRLRGRRPADAGQALHHHAIRRRCARCSVARRRLRRAALRRDSGCGPPVAGGPTVGETYVGTAGTSTLYMNSLAAVDPEVRGAAPPPLRPQTQERRLGLAACAEAFAAPPTCADVPLASPRRRCVTTAARRLTLWLPAAVRAATCGLCFLKGVYRCHSVRRSHSS